MTGPGGREGGSDCSCPSPMRRWRFRDRPQPPSSSSAAPARGRGTRCGSQEAGVAGGPGEAGEGQRSCPRLTREGCRPWVLLGLVNS